MCEPPDTMAGLKKCNASLSSHLGSGFEKARSKVRKIGPTFCNNCISITLMKLGKKTHLINPEEATTCDVTLSHFINLWCV